MSEQTTVTSDATDVTLSLNDIQNAVKVIDFAADQGAFKGWATIEQVLVVRSRLNNFLAAAQAQQEAAGTSEATETTEEVQG